MTDGAWTSVCQAHDLPEGACRAVAGGDVLLARVAGRVVAYRNSCLHRGGQLEEGFVREGYLICPLHFWRYRLADGRKVGSTAALEPVPVRVAGERVWIIPPGQEAGSIRDVLREHARGWRREEQT